MAETVTVTPAASPAPASPAVPDLVVLADRLADATGTPGTLSRPYLRLKPGTSCVVAATWTAHGREPEGVVVRAYAQHALPKLDKTVRKAAPADVLLVDRDAGLVVTTWRADRDVPGIAVLTDDARRAALAATWPADLRAAFAHAPRLLRHNPERRAVLRADGPGDPLLVRAVRPADVARVVRGYAALADAPVPSPAVLAVDEALGLVVTTWLDGTPLDGLPHDTALLRGVGETVATLQRPTPPTSAAVDEPADEAVHLGVEGGWRTPATVAAEAVAVLLPHLADDARRVAERVDAARDRTGAGRRVLAHGDLSLDQVVLAPDGTLALVDADAAGPGGVADDLGSLVASLVRDDARRAPAAVRAVLDGYRAAGGTAGADAVRVAAADHLLRRATEPFRRQEPAWQDACAVLVGAALAALDRRGAVARAIDQALPADGDPPRASRLRDGRRAAGTRGASGATPRVRYAPRTVEIAVRFADDGRTLRAALPRSAEHVLLVGTERSEGSEDPSRLVAGQWFADAARGARVAGRLGPDGTLVSTDRGAAVLQHDGADLHLPGLAAAARRPGARLVAHRPGRRGVVRDPAGTFTKLVRPGRTVAAPAVPDDAFATPVVLSRGDGSATTSALPGRTLHALLADPAVPDTVLARAGRAVGRGLRRLQDGDRPAAPAGHDADAELAVVGRWWSWAVAHEAAAASVAHDVLGRVDAALAASLPAAPVPTHRDLHDKQLLVDERAPDRAGLLDLDLATTAHPALDLANLLVHLELRALQGVCTTARAAVVSRAVLDGYAPADHVLAALPAWATAARARLVAVYAFRPAPGDMPGRLLDAVLDGSRRPTLLEEA